jgi:hypothetical protein
MLDVAQLPLTELFALIAAIAFAAGLNVYVTVAALGLFAHFGNVPLPPALLVLKTWPIIGTSVALFVVEFFADKIPAFDLVWNALHTFVRVPVAAWLAYAATRQLTPAQQLLAASLGAAIALAAHGGKTAVRAAVTPSPEPFSNITLSLGEDILAAGLTWLATRYPYIAGTVALCLVATIILLARFVIRATLAIWRGSTRKEARSNSNREAT